MVESLGPYGAGLLLAAVGYLAAAAVLWRDRGQRPGGRLLIAATVLTALWAASGLLQSLWGTAGIAAHLVLEVLRTGAWLVLLLVLFRQFAPPDSVRGMPRDPVLWLVVGTVGVALVSRGLALTAIAPEIASRFALGAALVLAILGLVLVDSLRRSSDESRRWAVKHLLIGAGVGIFGYDLYFYTEGLLLHALNPLSAAARPFVNLLALPLILVSAARLRGTRTPIGVSRHVALQTTALIASGIYLLAVAAAGYMVREIGLAWGATMQIVLLAAAGLTLMSLLTSGQARARFRHFIAENFFTFLFDYRREWMRFVETMENPDSGKSLYERAIRALAQPFDCSGGALYLRGRGERYELAANDTWRTARNLPSLPESVVEEVLEAPSYLPLDSDRQSHAVTELRAHLDRPRLAVALRHRGRPLGIVVIGHARVDKPLSWEARDVLNMLARQVAGYLAEEQITRQLMAAQKFERISRTFSYVAHDLKNVVSQLGVVVKRAEKYGDDPEFQQDAMETVAHAVDSMKALLARIRDGDGDDAAVAEAASNKRRADVAAIAADVARRRGLKTGHVTFDTTDAALWTHADGTQLAAVLDNLVQNALEASTADAPVAIAAGREADGRVRVEITDQGSGMTPAFIRESLFQPFASTKAEGFGLGMYQCREWVEGWGGVLEIDSVYGAGTTARVLIPAAETRPASTSLHVADPETPTSSAHPKEAVAHG